MPIEQPLFYHPALDSAEEAVLGGDEARHVAAQRLRVGAAIALFDGRGQVARGRIDALSRNQVRIRIAERSHIPPASPRIDLYSAVPKGERFSVLLDMVTQLGISRVVPVAWQRSLADRGMRASERWQRICVEACKQSRRVYVPEVAAAVTTEKALKEAGAAGARLLVAHLHSEARPLLTVDLTNNDHLALFVGPEGGLTEAEEGLVGEARGQFVRLGGGVLRIETAAVAFTAMARAMTGPTKSRG